MSEIFHLSAWRRIPTARSSDGLASREVMVAYPGSIMRKNPVSNAKENP
jgi:hypothetical protein